MILVINYHLKKKQILNMVLMMVQENMTQRGVSVEMINGTVREVKEFLEAHPEEAEKYWTQKKIISTDTISIFLGWNHARVQWSLERLHLIEDKIIDPEAINMLGTTGRSDGFKKAIRKVNRENIESGLRNPDLGWSHHREVAKLEPENQEYFY